MPAGHLTEMADSRVSVLLDGDKLGILREEDGWLQTRLVAPKARWERKVPCFIIHSRNRIRPGAVAVGRVHVA